MPASSWVECSTCYYVSLHLVAASFPVPSLTHLVRDGSDCRSGRSLPGLASATIQLGTATFQFYQQLRSLHKAIKQGRSDLTTAGRRLGQHETFIEELKFNFGRIPDGQISDGLRDLFRQCISNSVDEVKEFGELLQHVGKNRFKGKSLQAIETDTRLRFNEESIQKYYNLLDTQMARFLFFETSAQSSRMTVAVPGVEETLTRHEVKATAFYSSFESTMQSIEASMLSRFDAIAEDARCDRDERFQQATGAVGRRLKFPRSRRPARYTDNEHSHELMEYGSNFHSQREYRTFCCRVTVMNHYPDPRGTSSKSSAFAYTVRFEPFSWISRSLVEWKCFISVSGSVPLLMLSSVAGTVCEDVAVLDALGFIPCKQRHARRKYKELGDTHWHAKIPDSKKLRVLLDTRRISHANILDVPDVRGKRDVLTAYINLLEEFDDMLTRVKVHRLPPVM
ncbi:Uu.00g030430.m01.CDS01 [Anthostomella pinea]|uniref:Uu.00g030430.m01.CDS01 n=1 Tax=Anthostomella pinea TaxID=933095 RepID=A0AAI8YCY5_9PEZI|nr:Uu.00g030430.m01.CDS01 [Anthostomella pinea]